LEANGLLIQMRNVWKNITRFPVLKLVAVN